MCKSLRQYRPRWSDDLYKSADLYDHRTEYSRSELHTTRPHNQPFIERPARSKTSLVATRQQSSAGSETQSP
jgi:hypothetical protein